MAIAIDVDQHAIGRLAVAAVTRDDVAVIEMGMITNGERQHPARVDAQPASPIWLD